MNGISIPMAIVDTMPVILFLITNIKLMDSLYNKMSKDEFAMLSSGALMLFAGALCKIIWKFLYALQICDYTILSDCFFPMQSIGFILMTVSLTKMLKNKKGSASALNAAAIPVIGTKMPFLLITLIAMSYFHVLLCIIAVKLKKKKTIFMFVLSYAGMLCNCFVGSASTGEAVALYHWIAELTHLFAEIFLLCGVTSLCNAGLKEKNCFE